LEYATELVKTLPIKKLNAMVDEMTYQRAMDDYKLLCNFSLIIATMVSTKQRKYKVSEIAGQPPHRKQEPEKIKAAAKKAGIKVPEE
jgi:hypothetical protein